jgi:hypothetical protein
MGHHKIIMTVLTSRLRHRPIPLLQTATIAGSSGVKEQ